MGPFDIINDILYKKENIVQTPEDEQIYSPFLTNRNLSQFIDTTMQANEMNRMHYLDKRMQHDYLFHSIRSKKRFSKWAKADKDDRADLLVAYYNCTQAKARVMVELVTPSFLEQVKEFLSEGGTRNK